MKQGKVFDKLIARKNVQGIEFADKTCTVTLTDGASKVCKTAHEARLFIEGKDLNGAVLKMTAPVVAQVAAVITPQPELDAFCPAEIAAYCTVSADWARFAARGIELNIPNGTAQVRVTREQLTALVLNNILAAA